MVRLSLQSEQDIKSLKCGLFAVYKLEPLQSGKKEHRFFISVYAHGMVTNTTSFFTPSPQIHTLSPSMRINEFEVRRPSPQIHTHTHTQSPPKNPKIQAKRKKGAEKTYVLED